MKSSKLKNKWYERVDVLERMIMFTRFKEIAFIGKTGDNTTSVIRYLKAWNVKYFKDLLRRFNNYENISIYISIAHVKLPFIPYFVEQRKTNEAYLNMKKSYAKFVMNYDLVFDFDAPLKKDKTYNLNLAKKDAVKLAEYFDKKSIPIRIIFSGNKGFQITIISSYLHLIKKLIKSPVELKPKIFKEYATDLKKKLKLKTLDTEQYKTTQLVKLPYSYCNKYVCIPLTFIQLKKFKKDDYNIKKLINKNLK